MASSSFPSLIPIYDARRLLELSNDKIRLTKEDIQKAFLQSAQKYHPDTRHSPTAQPCPIKFRQCVQARDLLLHHYHGTTSTSSTFHRRGGYNPQSSSFYQNYYYNNNNNKQQHQNFSQTKHDSFAKGFPFRTLRLLTLKQKLAIRGTIMIIVSAGALYDKWVRMDNHQRRLQEEQEQKQ